MKKIISHALIGMCACMGAAFVVKLIISYVFDMGYYFTYAEEVIDQVGDELDAVLYLMLVSGGIGLFAGALSAICKRAFVGMCVLIALEFVVSWIVSSVLRLGYFMPYPAFMPERVGGELNAVLYQTIACGAVGAVLGALTGLLRRKKSK